MHFSERISKFILPLTSRSEANRNNSSLLPELSPLNARLTVPPFPSKIEKAPCLLPWLPPK
jgi:hypothetical protein